MIANLGYQQKFTKLISHPETSRMMRLIDYPFSLKPLKKQQIILLMKVIKFSEY